MKNSKINTKSRHLQKKIPTKFLRKRLKIQTAITNTQYEIHSEKIDSSTYTNIQLTSKKHIKEISLGKSIEQDKNQKRN